ncbi:helix-turn-helix domain-containing protein (plasmid) [Deinococcus sp. D7000]|nr:helix-turn-helix domain-containing protein [Deinococcus sp. D7000]
MPTLGELALDLGLSDVDPSLTFATPQEAVSLLPAESPEAVVGAATALLARTALGTPGVSWLLAALRDAALAPHPERELVRLAARWTGGFAEIVASWGDTVASAGRRAGQPGAVAETLRLSHAGRHVGSLSVAFAPGWRGLAPILAEYALLARLRTAAAGAARRRVGERMLDALLSGREAGGDTGSLEEGAFALAVATLPPSVPEQAQALDLLAAVGEGYFSERRLVGHATVRDGQAVWLWITLELSREARELHLALTASTALDLRVGVSGRHPEAPWARPAEVQRAFGEARQALSLTRQARGYSVFHDLDPLHALVSEGRLDLLAAQVSAQLETIGDDGRTADTLRAYLAHRGTLAELAGALDLHVNTLRYRLRRAEEALGGRLSDPALLAQLYLAFQAGRK